MSDEAVRVRRYTYLELIGVAILGMALFLSRLMPLDFGVLFSLNQTWLGVLSVTAVAILMFIGVGMVMGATWWLFRYSLSKTPKDLIDRPANRPILPLTYVYVEGLLAGSGHRRILAWWLMSPTGFLDASLRSMPDLDRFERFVLARRYAAVMVPRWRRRWLRRWFVNFTQDIGLIEAWWLLKGRKQASP